MDAAAGNVPAEVERAMRRFGGEGQAAAGMIDPGVISRLALSSMGPKRARLVRKLAEYFASPRRVALVVELGEEIDVYRAERVRDYIQGRRAEGQGVVDRLAAMVAAEMLGVRPKPVAQQAMKLRQIRKGEEFVGEHREYAARRDKATGRGEVRDAARTYERMVGNADGGEVLPAKLQPRAEEMRRRTGTDAKTLGASEGIVESSARPDPALHLSYQDLECGPETYRVLIETINRGNAQEIPDKTTAPATGLDQFALGQNDTATRFDLSSATRSCADTIRLGIDAMKLRSGGEENAGGEEEAEQGENRGAAAAAALPSSGRLFVRVSVNESGVMVPQMCALPMTRYQVESLLWKRGLEVGRFLYEPPADLCPDSILQTRRDGVTKAPPRLVVLGDRFRELVRRGKKGSNKWLARHEPEPEQRRRYVALSGLLTALAKRIYLGRIERLPFSFGANRMAQLYRRFVKNPMSALRGAINVARWHRSMPVSKALPREATRSREFMAALGEMRQGKRRMVSLVQEAPTPTNPSGMRIQYTGIRQALDQHVEEDPEAARRVKFQASGRAGNRFDGSRTFGATEHRARLAPDGTPYCDTALTGPGVATGFDPDLARTWVHRRRKRARGTYKACIPRSAAGTQQQQQQEEQGDEQQQQEEQGDEQQQQQQQEAQGDEPQQEGFDADAVLAEALVVSGCSRARTVRTQARLMQTLILSRRSWPTPDLAPGMRPFVRKESFGPNLYVDLDDAARHLANRDLVFSNMDGPDAGVLSGYVGVINGMLGGESIISSSRELELLATVLHRIALQHGIYIWPTTDSDFARSYRTPSPVPFDQWTSTNAQVSADLLQEVWRAEGRVPGQSIAGATSTAAWFVVAKVGGRQRRLEPRAMVEIRRSAITERVTKRGIRLGPELAALLHELCPQAAGVMAKAGGPAGDVGNVPAPAAPAAPGLRYMPASTAPGLRYMLADNIREVVLYSYRGKTRMNLLGAVVGMFAYANARTGSAATRSWIMELAGDGARVQEAVREVLWFQPLDGKRFAPTYARKRSLNGVLYYRPPTLAVEAALTAWSLVL
jgi:hypothetical protein